jgi:urease accessory protein UreH
LPPGKRRARASPTAPITIATATLTEPSSALLRVERTAGRHAVTQLRRGTRLAPRVLSKDGRAVRVCLVATQAGPLAGDHDRVMLGVGAGATLVVVSVGAAYALPGRAATLLELDIQLGAGSRIVFEDAPLIVAPHADVTRSTTVTLGDGAVAALRDVVVLGDEGRGVADVRLASTLRVVDRAGVLLHDELRVEPAFARDDAHVALAPGHRVVGTLCLFGERPPCDDPAALRLARGGTLRRATAPGMAAVDAELERTWSQWSSPERW